jgi:HSP20 family protein
MSIMQPFWGREAGWSGAPVVDVAEREKDYEITAELPGMDEKDIEVSLSDDVLTIKGEKKEEKEERQKDYHVSERRYGSFQRSLRVPDGVDANKIEAKFKNGVLTLILPKSPEAQKKKKKIEVKSG